MYGQVTGIQGTYWLTVASTRFGSEVQPLVADSVVTFAFEGDTIRVDPGVGCTLLTGEFSFVEDVYLEVSEIERTTEECDESDEERAQIALLISVLEEQIRPRDTVGGVNLETDAGLLLLVDEPTSVFQLERGDLHGDYHSTVVRHQDGTPRPFIEGAPLRLGFSGYEFSMFPGVGCNNSFGDFYVSDASEFVLASSGLRTTDVGCDFTDEEIEQANFVRSFIFSSPTIEIDGDTITMSNDEFVVELVDVDVLIEDGPLIGTDWTHNSFVTEFSVSRTARSEGARLQFIDETTAVGFDGCNEFTLNVTIGEASVVEPVEGTLGLEGTLSFDEPLEPHTICDRPNTDVVTLLLAATTYYIDGDFLFISDDDGVGNRFFDFS